MRVDLSQIIKEALEVSCEGFCKIVDETTQLLRMEDGKIGNFEISGRLLKLEPVGEALVVGDLHGDLESLIDILKGSNFIQKMSQEASAVMIFLGDYGDRGDYSAEVYCTVLKIKLLFQEQVILMRGNHEGPEDLLPSPYDLPVQFQTKFGKKWKKAHHKIRELFPYLCNLVLIKERYLMVHGGLPGEAYTIEDLAFAHVSHPKRDLLENMLWSDPDETVEETESSPRGAGRLFSEKVTKNALEKLNANIVIRGHEPCEEGFKVNHNGKVLTLFSRKGSPYFNACGAYLSVELSKRIENTEKLIPYIRKF